MSDNEIIANFLGYEKVTVGYFGSKDGDDGETEWQLAHKDWMKAVGIENVGDYIVNIPKNDWRHWEEVRYHKSWSQLMPVVEKIAETHDFTIQFYAGDCNCFCTKQNFGASDIPGVGHGGFKPHIQSVYKSVVALIKHINQQKK